MAAHTDENGVLWVSAQQHLYQYNQTVQKFEAVVQDVGYITGIISDHNNNLILRVDDVGVFVYNTTTKQLKPHVSGQPLPSKKLHSAAIDDQGKLWLGFYNATVDGAGLYSFDEQKQQYVRHLDKYNVEALLALDDHVLIATRRNGLRVMDKATGQWTVITDKTQDVSIVWNLYQDKQKQLWAAPNDAGLARVDLQNRKLTFVTMNDGLPTNTIYSIVEDQKGALWLGTAKGIAKYDPKTNIAIAFGAKHGLQVDSFNSKLAMMAKNGDIFLGAYEHLIRFSPSELTAQASQVEPTYPVLLSDFRLFNQPVDFNASSADSPIHQIINSVDELTLTYKDYWFSVAFSSSDYKHSDNLRFAYRLEGFNSQWIEADNSNLTATFTSLPAKDYTLMIRTGDKDGDWHQQYRSLKIKITPPWWKTWLAYGVYSVLILAGAYSFYRYRTKALVQRANELEQGVIERTATINRLMSQKERMFANISHEFKTPLTLILNPLESISLKHSETDFSRKVSMMKRNGQRLLRMVDQLLELSKAQTSHPKERHNYSLAETLEMLLISFQPLFDSKSLTLHHQPFDDVILSLKADSLEMVLTNLISNAIKYTREDGQITVAVSHQSKQVMIVVEDTGIGIDEQNQKIVFNRFTRANERHDENIPGAGIGLALVKELVEANEGTITLTSVINRGSTFTVTLPVGEQSDVDVEKVTELSISSLSEIDSLTKPQATDQAEAVVVQQQIGSGKPILLLIDDNPDMIELLKDTLSEKYQCLTEHNGVDGVAA
ncbi:MAG: ATP-binding protein, partial [Psychrosphaera sp.]|nr:ATP-binding protein [Psychrosphaera sp.]